VYGNIICKMTVYGVANSLEVALNLPRPVVTSKSVRSVHMEIG